MPCHTSFFPHGNICLTVGLLLKVLQDPSIATNQMLYYQIQARRGDALKKCADLRTPTTQGGSGYVDDVIPIVTDWSVVMSCSNTQGGSGYVDWMCVGSWSNKSSQD